MKLDLKAVRVVGKPLVLATAAQVDALEKSLWITFPAGYREYVTRFGQGVLGGSLVRIYPPWQIERELAEWRRRIDKYWFWDAGRRLLPKERALECVILGDTLNGDELVFHPTRPGHLFVLPRDSEQVFDAGPDLLSAVEWMCASGKLVEPFPERDFEPFDSRKERRRRADATAEDAPGESLDDLLALARRWAARHGVRKLARKEAKPQAGPGGTLELLHESLVLDAKFPHAEPGYAIAWRALDKSGRELGVFRWGSTGDSQSMMFEPNN